jgi:hypothetical protein
MGDGVRVGLEVSFDNVYDRIGLWEKEGEVQEPT